MSCILFIQFYINVTDTFIQCNLPSCEGRLVFIPHSRVESSSLTFTVPSPSLSAICFSVLLCFTVRYSEPAVAVALYPTSPSSHTHTHTYTHTHTHTHARTHAH